jgi:hypothetical protein
LLAAVGCADPAPRVTTVSIGAHALPGCPVPNRGPQDPSPFRLTLTALGDFPQSNFDLETDIGLDESGRPLAFNAATSGVDAVARDSPTDTALTFAGHTESRRGDAIDVLLWPAAQACPLAAATSGVYPGGGAGQALGFSASTGVVLAAGENADDQRSESALTFDSDRGDVASVERAHGTLHVSRAFATVSEFGGALLVAGGTNPSEASSPVDAPSTAEVFTPASGGFEPELVELWSRRAHHAALRLPMTGETLLVGGFAPDSASTGPGQLIHQLEAISPVTRSSSITDLDVLELGRADPIALLLSDGRILVGGGSSAATGSADALPVGMVEELSPDAKGHLFYVELPKREARTFAALPGGGVLSVASCAAAQRSDCICRDATGGECDESDPDAPWIDAWWIDPDGNVAPVGLAPGNGLSLCPTPAKPMLVPGSDGSPWLISANDARAPACLFHFEAWPEEAPSAQDSAATSAPADRPRFIATTFTLEPAPDPRSAPLALGPDAFVWVPAGGGLYGARLGHRGPLTRDEFSLLASDPNAPFRPEHLVPDRDPRVSRATGADGSAVPAVAYVRSTKPTLTLAPAVPPVTLWAADTLYGDVLISLKIEAPADGGAPSLPLLVLASNTTGESVACAWPAAGAEASTPVTLTATRRGDTVTLVTPAATTTTCGAPAGSVALGVRASAGVTTLSDFELARLLLE